jgi:hypothetical protein
MENGDIPIKCFDFSKDKRSIFFWQLEDFNISVIRDPKESKKKTKTGKDSLSPISFLEKNLFDK